MIQNPMQLQSAMKPLMEKFLSDLHSHGYCKEGTGSVIPSYAERLVDALSRQNIQLVKTILSEIIPDLYFNDKESAPSLCLEFLSMAIQNANPDNMSIAFMTELKTLKTKYEIALKKPYKAPDISMGDNQIYNNEFEEQGSYTAKLLLVIGLGIVIAGGLILLSIHRKKTSTNHNASVTQMQIDGANVEHDTIFEEGEVVELVKAEDKSGKIVSTRRVQAKNDSEIDVDDVYEDKNGLVEEKTVVKRQEERLHVQKLRESLDEKGSILTGNSFDIPNKGSKTDNDEITQDELNTLTQLYGLNNQKVILYCYFNKKKNLEVVKTLGTYKELNMNSKAEPLIDLRNKYRVAKDCFLCFDPVKKNYTKLSSMPAVKKWIEGELAKDRAELKKHIDTAIQNKGPSSEVDAYVGFVTHETDKIMDSVQIAESDATKTSFGGSEIQDSEQLKKTLSSMKQKPVVIFLYLDECPPCAQMTERYIEISNRYRNKADFYAICCNKETELGQHARDFGINIFPSMLILTKSKGVFKPADNWRELFSGIDVMKLKGSAECKTLEMHLSRLIQVKPGTKPKADKKITLRVKKK